MVWEVYLYRPMTMDGFTNQVSFLFPELTASIWPQTCQRARLGALERKTCTGAHSAHRHTPIHTEAGSAIVGGNLFSQSGFDLRTLGFEWKSPLSQFPLCSIPVPHAGLPAIGEAVLAPLPHTAGALPRMRAGFVGGHDGGNLTGTHPPQRSPWRHISPSFLSQNRALSLIWNWSSTSGYSLWILHYELLILANVSLQSCELQGPFIQREKLSVQIRDSFQYQREPTALGRWWMHRTLQIQMKIAFEWPILCVYLPLSK